MSRPWSHRTRLALASGGLALMIGAAGCGMSTPVNPVNKAGITASHGGAVVPLDGGAGFAEVLVEEVKPVTKAKSGAIAVYFLKADGSGPIEPAPTDVSIELAGRGKVALVAKGDRFVSEPGPYPPGRAVDGELSASVAGAAVHTSIQTR